MIAASTPTPKIGEKTIEITSASWQAVPNTEGATEGYIDPAYIDINGIKKEENKVIFDVVNPDASYGRVEGNCSTNQIRSLRIGHFLTKTKVSYIEQSSDSWYEANPYQIKLLKFTCDYSEDK